MLEVANFYALPAPYVSQYGSDYGLIYTIVRTKLCGSCRVGCCHRYECVGFVRLLIQKYAENRKIGEFV